MKTYDLAVSGSLLLGTNGLTASGSLVARTGTLTTSTGVLLISKDTQSKLSLGSNSLQNLTINNGLVGYWRMDEGTGSTVAMDSSGNGNKGTLTNGPTWSTSVPSGLQFYDPKSLAFNGTNQSVNAGNAGTLSFGSTPNTVTAWIRLRSYGSYRPIVAKRSGSTVEYNYHIDNTSGDGKMASYNGSTSVGGNTVVTLNAWHHVAYVFQGGTVYFYLDGSTDGSAAQTRTANSQNVYIGQDNGSSAYSSMATSTTFASTTEHSPLPKSPPSTTALRTQAPGCIRSEVH